MEQDITEDEARQFIATHDAYGPTRLYGVIAEGEECAGQIVGLKSTYYLERYRYSRIYLKSTTITDMIGRA